MVDLPKRHSLVAQTADILEAEIARGTWKEWLPGERALCAKYQVSRNTIRAALAKLQRSNVIATVHGSGHRILQRLAVKAASAHNQDVALLMPVPPERLRPSQTLWIDELRALLGENKCLLRMYYGQQYLGRNPGQALSRLTSQHPHGCWILLRSNAATQNWFSKHHPRCLVVGTVYGGLPLAHRDLDHRAICRHAAGVLLGLGHRRIALLVPKPAMAGDLESETGLKEGISMSKRSDCEANICWHDGSPAGIGNVLRQLLTRKASPTALIVANTYHYLAAWSHLTQLGMRVPKDISIISRDEDQFLSYLVPSPARYIMHPSLLAKALLRPVLEILENGHAVVQDRKLIPEFFTGGTIDRCRAGNSD